MKTVKDIFRSYAVFDTMGRHTNGTDKESNHQYGDAYERILGAKRVTANLMMEIGVADGSSLIAWSEVFPFATIVGMDIHPAARIACSGSNPYPDKVEFYIGDQTSQVCCETAVAGRQFDVIVEDALHDLSASLLTLFYLWPSIKPGGLYIVEEFANVGALRKNIAAMWPSAEIVDTQGPFGGIEPLVVLRKPIL